MLLESYMGGKTVKLICPESLCSPMQRKLTLGILFNVWTIHDIEYALIHFPARMSVFQCAIISISWCITSCPFASRDAIWLSVLYLFQMSFLLIQTVHRIIEFSTGTENKLWGGSTVLCELDHSVTSRETLSDTLQHFCNLPRGLTRNLLVYVLFDIISRGR